MHHLCQAISSRRTVMFYYSGFMREVEPYLLGYDESGEMKLSAWQLSGGRRQGWREYPVSHLSGLSTTGRTFTGLRSDYFPKQETIDRIVCRFDPGARTGSQCSNTRILAGR